MKRFLVVGLALLIAGTAVSAQTTIKWSQFQVEVADQVNAMIKAYAAEHPDVTIDPTILSDPYWDQLKVRAAANEMPDVFMTDGYTRIKTYKNFILDLTGDKLTSNIVDGAKAAIAIDGKIVGLPVQMSAWGIVYNKGLFEKAGVKLPTTYPELVKACAALQAKGITPFVNQYKDNWVLGQLIGSAIGKVAKPWDFVNQVTAGKARLADQALLKRNIELLDLSLKYGQKNPLNDGWNEACTQFGQEKGAMMYEGVWVYDTIKSVNPDIRIGIMPLPYTDNAADTKLTADVNGVYHFNVKSKELTTVRKIFDWLLNSPSGQKFFADCKFIPAYKGMAGNLNEVGQSANTYIAAGKTTPFGWLISPDNFQAESGSIYQEYILGKQTAKTVLAALDARWAKLAGK